MKVVFYFDMWPGKNIMDGMSHLAYTVPTKKPDGWTRYAFEVEFPDLHQPDMVLPATTAKEVVGGLQRD